MPRDAPTLLLITASSPEIRWVRRSRVLNFQQITMPYLAAFVPPHWTVLHADEAVEPVDFRTPADLVAITFHTPSAPHAYALAARFRERGTTVALGGPHVTLLPDEAQAHADVIFVGEAEAHWPRFLAEFEAGRYRQRYSSTESLPLDDVPMSRKEYAKELFRALAPHRKWWSSQASIHAAQDDEFLECAARSGCKQLFIGMESISQASMNDVSKGFNRVDEYGRAIERIHSHGIAVQAGIVFGFDHDTPAVFTETLDFLEATGVQNATFNILTPFPGTRLHARLQAEGRILTRDWSRYNGRADVVFRPRHMSPEALLSGYQYANRRFYSSGSISKRLSRSPVQVSWTLPLNLAYAFALRKRR